MPRASSCLVLWAPVSLAGGPSQSAWKKRAEWMANIPPVDRHTLTGKASEITVTTILLFPDVLSRELPAAPGWLPPCLAGLATQRPPCPNVVGGGAGRGGAGRGEAGCLFWGGRRGAYVISREMHFLLHVANIQ